MPLDKHHYQPALLAGYATQWAKEHCPEHAQINLTQMHIFVRDKHGAYFIPVQSGKLYWDEEIGDSQFGNTDQDGLWRDRERLAEVQVRNHYNLWHFESLEKFIEGIEKL